MSDNNRIYYATKGLAIKKSGISNLGNPRLVQTEDMKYQNDVTVDINGVEVAIGSGNAAFPQPYGLGQVSQSGIWEVPRGVQTVGITSTHNLEDVFQQGQLALYEQVEERPEIEMTVSRVLDGTHPLYLMCTFDNNDTVPSGAYNVNARANGYSVDMALMIYNDDVSHASGVRGAQTRPAVSRVLASGMFISSVTYTFPVDGNATEECTFVGNDKYWSTDSTNQGTAPLTAFPDENLISTDEDATAPAFGIIDGLITGITRREDIVVSGASLGGAAGGLGAAAWPSEIPTNDINCVQNITVSVDLGQEEILCLGAKSASTRYVTFPIEVTASFEVTSSEGDMIEANFESELANQTIIILTKQGLKIDLGTKNKLASIDFSGGDTGGGNVTVTYNYRNSNEFTVSHARFV
jgi:hypothetical protein